MAKIDMHVHSKFSGRPSHWFLQKFGTYESYTEPEIVYNFAKEQGMDFITITDHNNIEASLILQNKYPDDVITGCEYTTYFPEDGCKIHLLVYGINQQQFEDMNILRENIYELRDYIKQNKIAYSIAHTTYSINGKLTINHLEKLILLFDVFEGINGSRNRLGNDTWMEVLTTLTSDMIDELYKKHGIKPISSDPWIKGLTGGSDDHAALFIGQTYTETEAKTASEFIEKLKDKKTLAFGRQNDYISFAFALYKILYDFSKSQSSKINKSLISEITKFIYEKKGFSFLNWLKIKSIKKSKRKNIDDFKNHLYDLIDTLKKNPMIQSENKFELIFYKISDIFDSFLKVIIKSTEKNIKKGDFIDVLKNITSLLPGLFLSGPFFSTLFHMYSIRPLIEELKARFLKTNENKKKKIIWFTDTLNDLNGVSVTIKKIGWQCFLTGRNLKIVSSLKNDEINDELPLNLVNIPYIYDFNLPFYENINLKIPSILKTIEMLYKFEPDEVFISTPGPIGLLGLLFAKLISAKTTGIYHTDFTEQTRKLVKDESFSGIVEIVTKFFFSSMDKLAVPTQQYIDILANRGFDKSKMTIFKRGIDDDSLKEDYEIFYKSSFSKEDFTMLYAGRISEDKNLDFLIKVFKELKFENNNLKLIIAGDGPYYKELKHKCDDYKGINFTGRLKRTKLMKIYSFSDLFVFPSETDTFGMVVLEAQSRGLISIVSDVGGPREIIIDKETGFIESTNSKENWIRRINYMINLKKKNPSKFLRMRKYTKEYILGKYKWDNILKEIFEENEDDKEYMAENKLKNIYALKV